MRVPFIILATLVIYLAVLAKSQIIQGPLPPPPQPPQPPPESDTNDENPKSKNNEEKKSVLEENIENAAEAGDLHDYSFQSSAIKIVKAPDLSQEKEAKKVSEMISDLLESHGKWIQKMESEIEEIDNNVIAENEEIEVELTPEELEAQNLYESAMAILNKTRGDKIAGHTVLYQAAQKGHPLAKAKISWSQVVGNPLELNIEAAKKEFLELSKTGLPSAHMGLGFMYAAGIGFNVSQSKALVHYTMAALGDNTWAQMALGYRYWAGVSVPNSCEKALDFYRRVAAKVAAEVTFSGGAAVHRIRLLDEVENSGLSSGILDNDLIEYYQLLAEKGDVQAQLGLGQLHYQGGRGIALDHQKALEYFTQAANTGNPVAMAFLGKIYLEGSENIKADNDTAYKVCWFN